MANTSKLAAAAKAFIEDKEEEEEYDNVVDLSYYCHSDLLVKSLKKYLAANEKLANVVSSSVDKIRECTEKNISLNSDMFKADQVLQNFMAIVNCLPECFIDQLVHITNPIPRRQIKNVLPIKSLSQEKLDVISMVRNRLSEKPGKLTRVSIKVDEKKVIVDQMAKKVPLKSPPKELKEISEKPILAEQLEETESSNNQWSSHPGSEIAEDCYGYKKDLFSEDEEDTKPETKIVTESKIDEAKVDDTSSMSWSKIVSTETKPPKAKSPTDKTVEQPNSKEIIALYKRFTDLVEKIEPKHKWLCFITATRDNPSPNNLDLAKSIRMHMDQLCLIGRGVEIETLLSTANPKPNEIPIDVANTAILYYANLWYCEKGVEINFDTASDDKLDEFDYIANNFGNFYCPIEDSDKGDKIAYLATKIALGVYGFANAGIAENRDNVFLEQLVEKDNRNAELLRGAGYILNRIILGMIYVITSSSSKKIMGTSDDADNIDGTLKVWVRYITHALNISSFYLFRITAVYYTQNDIFFILQMAKFINSQIKMINTIFWEAIASFHKIRLTLNTTTLKN